jgi:hypothetical protein
MELPLDKHIKSSLYNTAIKSFGEDTIINIISSFYNTYKLPIVSVGSGLGLIEYITHTINPDINFICVDPDPMNFPSDANKYISKPFIQPQYNYVDDLPPELINNCILFLNWCCPNESMYDYDAIIKLKPKAVLSIIEKFGGSDGCAGGSEFFIWSKQHNNHIKQSYHLYDYYDEHEKEYYDSMDIQIHWYDLEHIYKEEEREYNYIKPKIKHNQQCIIN